MIDRLVLATKNPHKVAEMSEILDRVWPGVDILGGLDWPEVDETGDSLEDNALLKARAAADATGVTALADDTGLEVAALGGAPGVRSARFAGPGASYADNRAELLARMEGVEDRRARFRTVVALVSASGEAVTAEGTVEGTIATAERGDGGFGYDSLFEVGDRTLAQLSESEKNRLSHRANALAALVTQVGRDRG